MEPLQGWGPPPWSLTPKAEALSLTLYLLLLRVPHGALAMALCKEEEFPVGATCCPKCSPGHRVKEACGETTGTVCAPCSPGTYTAHLNGLDACLPCRVCDPDMGLVTRRKCSSTRNTVCGCDRGHFCMQEDRDECAECRNHSDCRPGQRMQETGTEWQDTVCEDCPPGTFSAGGTQAVCEPWTKCRGLLETEAKPGTSSTDVTCSSSVKVAVLCVCTVTLLITVTVLLGYSGIRVRRSRGKQQPLVPSGLRSQHSHSRNHPWLCPSNWERCGMGCPGGRDFLSEEPCATQCLLSTMDPELPSALRGQRSTGHFRPGGGAHVIHSLLGSLLTHCPLHRALCLPGEPEWQGEQALSRERHRESGRLCPVSSPREGPGPGSEQPGSVPSLQILGHLLLCGVLTPLPGRWSNWAELGTEFGSWPGGRGALSLVTCPGSPETGPAGAMHIGLAASEGPSYWEGAG